jgi:cellulose biosynthesis protein BcsQ
VNAPVVAFFNNKGGVGKTTLVYHLAWMYADLGVRVLAGDLDPQANLSTAFLDEDRLEEIWPDGKHPATVFGAVEPLLRGIGDIAEPDLVPIDPNLALLAGDLSLSRFEDLLSQEWPKCNDRDERAFRVISAFWRTLQRAARQHEAELILIDLGPNLGAINRASLISADFVVVPLSPDLFSLQGLRNLGPALHRWREEWKERLTKNPAPDLPLPAGRMEPAGYVVLQHSVRLDRPVRAYDRWISRIPREYQSAVLAGGDDPPAHPELDKHCLKLLKHYRSLIALAQEARKPMFHLRAGDGAIGAHYAAAQSVSKDFRELAEVIARIAGVPFPCRLGTG